METKSIKVTNLFLDLDNYRFEHQSSQLDAINKMIEVYGDKLYKLAVDILTHGLNPTDIPIVVESPADNGKYIVKEGNRRITVLKILLNPNLIEDINQSLKKKFIKLAEVNKKELIRSVTCAICDAAEADVWIERKHSTDLKGIGTQQWNSIQRQRFKEATAGKMSYALQIIKLLNGSSYVDEQFKSQLEILKITNLQRLIADPVVREYLGMSLIKGKLTSDLKEEVLVNALKEVVTDMMAGDFKVSKIYDKKAREEYIHGVFQKTGSPNTITNKTDRWELVIQPEQQKEEKEQNKETRVVQKKPRATLVPKSCNLPIDNPRVASIFREMKGLLVRSFVNTAAIQLRVFLEMSVDVYIETFHLLAEGKLTSSKSGKSLSEKANIVIDHLKSIKAVNTDMTKGMEFALQNKQSPMSPESLNSYVHNHLFSPMAEPLLSEWDNVQPFFESLWQAVANKKGKES